MRTAAPHRRHASRGFSIVELMVAVAIGLVLTLAVTTLLVRGEGRSRNTLAVNDINQGGAFVASMLDNVVRSAGSGFANRWNQTFGCRINASRGGAAVLPRSSDWPEPFAGFTRDVRVAPVIIGQGQSAAGSDVIAVMRGNSGIGEMPLEVLALGPPLGLRNTLGMAANELLLLADGEDECLLMQAGTSTADTVALTGTGAFHTITGTHRGLADFGTPTPNTVVVALGNAGPAAGAPVNAPQFQLYGVGDDRTLFALDLLGIESTVPQPIADGVVELRALYGIDADDDGMQDGWADPGVSPYTAAELLAGTPAAQANIGRIVAVRIALLLATSRIEREAVSPASVTMFADLDASLHRTRTLSSDEQRTRQRVVEVTVPLRNVLLARNAP